MTVGGGGRGGNRDSWVGCWRYLNGTTPYHGIMEEDTFLSQ